MLLPSFLPLDLSPRGTSCYPGSWSAESERVMPECHKSLPSRSPRKNERERSRSNVQVELRDIQKPYRRKKEWSELELRLGILT